MQTQPSLAHVVERLIEDGDVQDYIESVWVDHNTVLNPPQVEVWVVIHRFDPHAETAIYEALRSLYRTYPEPTEVDIRVFERSHHPGLELPTRSGQILTRPVRPR